VLRGRFKNNLITTKITQIIPYSANLDGTTSGGLIPVSGIVGVPGLLLSKGSRANSESEEEPRTSYGVLTL